MLEYFFLKILKFSSKKETLIFLLNIALKSKQILEKLTAKELTWLMYFMNPFADVLPAFCFIFWNNIIVGRI